MKKLLALLLSFMMILTFTACGRDDGETNATYKVAMITDYGDITDESFNQTTYEGAKAFCEKNSVEFTYYKPASNSSADRVAMIDKAVADGYNVILMPGYAFGEAIRQTADIYPDVKIIAIDLSEKDLGDYTIGNNVFCAVYQEELAGFLAGVAAVELGYKHLGFLGGMENPAVVRYGYGFVQGADWAAADRGGIPVEMEYVYGNQFFGDADITAYMDTWYGDKVDVVFACGGGIYTSVAEAAAKAGGKVIGVDVDQAATIDKYGAGMTITSAMKGLAITVQKVLEDLIINDKWSDYGGKCATLGIVSGDDPSANYVQLAPSTQWAPNGFNEEAYRKVVAQLYDGTIKVSGDISQKPTTKFVKVNYHGNIK